MRFEASPILLISARAAAMAASVFSPAASGCEGQFTAASALRRSALACSLLISVS
jgi:hypothetical protein